MATRTDPTAILLSRVPSGCSHPRRRRVAATQPGKFNTARRDGRAGRLLLRRRCRAALARAVPGELDLLGLELLDEVGKAAGLDDLVELRAVVRDEAHALDVDVVHQPLVPLLEEAVVDGD